MPKKFRHKFVNAFKRNPKAFIGFTKSHQIIHVIKILDKYKLVAIVMPFLVLALILSFLPNNIVWTIFIGSLAYLLFRIMRLFKTKTNKK
jgi:hypothetical protein